MVGDVQMPERYRDDANHYEYHHRPRLDGRVQRGIRARTIGVRVRVFETYERLLSPRSTSFTNVKSEMKVFTQITWIPKFRMLTS
jgi:hypothetical protein